MNVPSPNSLSGDENLFAHIIDLFLNGDLSEANALYESHELRVSRAASAIEPNSSGSWNIPILAAGCQFLLGDQRQAERLMLEYLSRQLDPQNPKFHGGFMGREVLSSLYCWPPMVVLLVMSRTRNAKLKAQSERWLSIYALLLVLGCWRARHEGLPFSIFMAGARTDVAWIGNPYQAVFLMVALGQPVGLNRSMRDSFEAWPARLVITLRSKLAGLFSNEDKRRFLAHIQKGGEAAWIAQRLHDLGARLRTRFEFYRWRDGLATVMQTNLHPSTPPVCATVRTRDGWAHLSPYPQGFRGHGARAVGNHRVIVDLDERTIHSLTKATWAGVTPNGRTVDGGKVRVDRELPLGPFLFKLSVGPRGVELDGAEIEDSSGVEPGDEHDENRFIELAGRIAAPLDALNADYQRLENGEDAFELAWRRVRNMARTFESFSENRP